MLMGRKYMYMYFFVYSGDYMVSNTDNIVLFFATAE